MLKSKRLSPVIIIGMHRSGTSLITRFLEKLGLFVGRRKDPNHESIFFLRLNNWMLRQSGGSWDHPKPIHYLMEDRKTRSLVKDYLMFQLKTQKVVSYLGLAGYFKNRSIYNISIPWGWKDPRNTFTLPIWLDLFREAKVIHIYRHGVDIAQSLKIRQDWRLSYGKQRFKRYKLFYTFRPKYGGFSDSIRCSTLEGGFSLWEEYMAEAERHICKLSSQAMSVKYEDFLTDPENFLVKLALFCNLKYSRTAIINLAKTVKKSRAYAYRSESDLQVFAECLTERLATYGY